jgi:hypothetical protein
VAVIGPIVDPQGMLFRDENTCVGRPADSQIAAYRCADVDEVAYR